MEVRKQTLCTATLEANKENSQPESIPGCFGRGQQRNKKKALMDVNCLSPRNTAIQEKPVGGDRKLPPLPPPRMESDLKDKGLAVNSKGNMAFEKFTMVMRKLTGGYGFTVTGGSPAIIGRVDENSPAGKSGLKKLDRVIKINGQNMTSASADMVAKFVRNSTEQIIMEVQRFVKINDKTNGSDVKRGIPVNEWDSQSVTDSEMTEYSLKRNPWWYSKASMLGQEGSDNDDDDETVTLLSSQCERFLPESQNFRKTQSVNRRLSLRCPDSLNSHGSSSGRLEESCNTTCTSMLPDFTRYSASVAAKKFGQDNLCISSSTLNIQDLPLKEQERQTLIHNMIDAERRFVEDMMTAVQHFGRPLRHRILTPALYENLFQNLEKIVALCELNQKNLQATALDYWDSNDNAQHYIDSVGVIYNPKAKLLSDMLRTYCLGLNSAEQLWSDLQQTEQVQNFIHKYMEDPRVLSMDEFLRRPIQHLRDLTSFLDNILMLTSPTHTDYRELRPIVLLLRSCHEGMSCTGMVTRRVTSASSVISGSSGSSSSSGVSRRSRTSGISHASEVSSGYSSRSSNDSCHIDPDLIELQNRLVIPDSFMRTFDLPVPNRHVIFSADIFLPEGEKVCKLWAIMCSDLILFTKELPNTEDLRLISRPLYFTDIHDYNFATAHPCEFQLLIHKAGLSTLRLLRLQAFSLEQKCTWRSLFEQRVSVQRSRSSMVDHDMEDVMSLATHLTFM